MTRRYGTDSPEGSFGSDSFLDVVANTVGVLIILIVLAGVRVRNAPPSERFELDRSIPSIPANFIESHLQYESEKARILAENLVRHEAYLAALSEQTKATNQHAGLLAARKKEQEEQNKIRDAHMTKIAERLDAQKELDAQARVIQNENDRLAADLAKLKAEVQAQRQAGEDAKKTLLDVLAQRNKELADQRTKLQQANQQLQSKQDSIETVASNLLRVQSKLNPLRDKQPTTKTLMHKAASIAQRIETHELHFRCSSGRIAYTYLDELLEQTREQANARITPSTMRLNGVAGPIGGFRLRYTLARPPMSMSEQLTQPSYRFALVHWELGPDSERTGESTDEVLLPNSAFRVKLRSAPATTNAITIWVYPDSFVLAKRVEAFLHEQGYVVSLRPLPKGVPIVGSPYGSSSYSR